MRARTRTRSRVAMLNKIIQWSINNRLIVVVGAAVLLVYGGVTAVRAPVDVFPDLTAPTVTILTESHGMAPEEVEALVSLPIEAAMNGTAGLIRVPFNLGCGISNCLRRIHSRDRHLPRAQARN